MGKLMAKDERGKTRDERPEKKDGTVVEKNVAHAVYPLSSIAFPRAGTEGVPAKRDAPFYTEEELDALYEQDPVRALKISREQHRLKEHLTAGRALDPDAPLPTEPEIAAVLDEARAILLRDGGDLEFVALQGDVLQVRLKGNCADAALRARSEASRGETHAQPLSTVAAVEILSDAIRSWPCRADRRSFLNSCCGARYRFGFTSSAGG
jgi:hypothetical protein